MSQTNNGRTSRRPLARHGRLRTPGPIAQAMKGLAVALAVVLVSTVGVTVFAGLNAAGTLRANAVTLEGGKQLPPQISQIKGGVNLLLVGTDSCAGQSLKLFPRCGHDDGGERNDVTMLVHISDKPRRVTVVSFPRDLEIPIPSCPKADGSGRYSSMSQQMLNSSYSYGGLPCTALTIEQLAGVKIQFAAAIRWTGVIHMSDAIGGVQVCLAGDINNRDTGLHLKKGIHTLKGVKALQFLRIRHGIGDGSDLGRISNQQQFMGSLIRKLEGGGVFGDPATLFNFAGTAMTQVTTKQLVLSESLADPATMVQIAMALKGIPYKDIVFLQYPTYYSNDGGRVYPLTDQASVLFEALKANRPLHITGKASDGYAVEVKGQATPAPTATPKPAKSSSAKPGASKSPTPTAPATKAPTAVDLPSGITGSTAQDVTCTVPQH